MGDGTKYKKHECKNLKRNVMSSLLQMDGLSGENGNCPPHVLIISWKVVQNRIRSTVHLLYWSVILGLCAVCC